MKRLLGIDIGGTKCAACLGSLEGDVLRRLEVPTQGSPTGMLETLASKATGLFEGGEEAAAIGIACGGPLDLAGGRVMSPPNLPGWDAIPIVEFFHTHFGIPTFLQNDANAGALAEWQFGAGRGSRNMMFCTMGTGFGCGLILDGKLFTGSNGNAGELGHVRLTGTGPMGYGKAGSVEGWCSGGGIAQVAELRLKEWTAEGKGSALSDAVSVTAQTVAEAARSGDILARAIFSEVGERLGCALAVAVDLLNLERIVIGSIFSRCEDLIRPSMEASMQLESLGDALKVCAVVPSGLGEGIGYQAALTVAITGMEGNL